jgi:quinolinate synthase
LRTGRNEIQVDETIRRRAVTSIQRMLDFALEHGISGKHQGNA